MSQATYSRNPIVSAAVYDRQTATATMYTCPPNSYALISITLSASGASSNCRLIIGTSTTTGVPFYVSRVGADTSNIPAARDENGALASWAGMQGSLYNVVVGPGQSVYFVNGSGTCVATISGVQFTNG